MRMWVLILLLLSAHGSVQAENLDDPMRPPEFAPPGVSAKAKKGWRLSAIRIDADQRLAIINGRRLEKGDWINRAQVVEILPQQVKLRGADGVFSVRLLRARIKKQSSALK